MAISFECGCMLYCTCGAVVVIFQFSSIINYSLFIINSKKRCFASFFISNRPYLRSIYFVSRRDL